MQFSKDIQLDANDHVRPLLQCFYLHCFQRYCAVLWEIIIESKAKQTNKIVCSLSWQAQTESPLRTTKGQRWNWNRPRPTVSAHTAALALNYGRATGPTEAVFGSRPDCGVSAGQGRESFTSVWVVGGNRGGTDRAKARKGGSKSTKGQTTESKWSQWLKRGEISSNHKYSWPGRKLYKERFFVFFARGAFGSCGGSQLWFSQSLQSREKLE